MSYRHKATLCAATAASFFAILLTPARSQAPTAEEKAKLRAKQIAQILELNSRAITIFDRQGKVVKTVGPKGFYQQPVFSPDGKRIAVVVTDLHRESADPFAQSVDIFVFEVATGGHIRLTTSGIREQAMTPVWSPDGSQIAYVALRNGTNGLYRKPSSGQGAEELLYNLPGAGYVLSDWSLDGRFLNFSIAQLGDSRLFALPLDVPRAERRPVEVAKSSATMLAPRLSPDSRFVAYRSDESGKGEVYVQSFDPVGGNSGKWKISDGGVGMAAWRRDGRELFYLGADRGIMSVPVSTSPSFEAEKPELLFKLPESIPVTGTPGGFASVSRDGEQFAVIVPPSPPELQISVYDREGQLIRTAVEPGLFHLPALSPDGTRVAVVHSDSATNNLDIWNIDIATGRAIHVTDDDAADSTPIWSSDGKQIYYASQPRDGRYTSILRKAAGGSGTAEQLFRWIPGGLLTLSDVSADGKYLTFSSGGVIFTVTLTGADPLARKAVEYLRSEDSANLGRFSPDTRYMALLSDESGRDELWVRSFDPVTGAAPDGKWRVSKGGAEMPMGWRADGKELYYAHIDPETGDASVMAAAIDGSYVVQPAAPALLFHVPQSRLGNPGIWKGVSADGQHFVFTIPVESR